MLESQREDPTLRLSGRKQAEPEDTLPSPEELDARFTKYTAVIGLAPVPPVLLYLWCTTRMNMEQVWFLGKFAILGTVLGITIGTILRKRGGGDQDKILEYVRHRKEGTVTSEMRAQAFTATLILPRMLFKVSFFAWCLALPIGALLLTWRFDDFSLLSAICFGCSGIAGAVLCTVPSFSIWKNFLAPVRETIAAEFERAHERAPLVPRLPLSTKFMFPVLGLIVVALLFGTTLSEIRAGRTIERTFVQIQEQALQELAPRLEAGDSSIPEALADSGEQWSAVGVEFIVLDSNDMAIVEGDKDALSPGEIRVLVREAAEKVVGNSASFDSTDYFAWRPLPAEGRFIVAVTHPRSTGITLWRNLLVVFAILVAAAISAIYGARDLVRDILVMRSQVQRMTAGDLTPGRAFDSEDELGDLAREIQTLGETLRETVGEVAAAAERVDNAAVDFSEAGQNVARVTVDQMRGVKQVSDAIDGVTSQIHDLAESSRDLRDTASESAASVLELKTTSQELTGTAEDLAQKAAETSSSIEQSMHNLGEISRSTEALAGNVADAASSMDEMARTVQEVDRNASEGSRLSSLVVDVADRGRERVDKTIEGMKAIRESTEMAEEVIRSLSKRTEEIGEFTNVITQIADETNLLALNAAIIAAQAGDHGRPFAVVADEIKKLANSVLVNTKEIAVVIESLQEETSRAVGVIDQGSLAVQSGVSLSDEAGRSLVEITDAARESGDRMKEIVLAVTQQTAATAEIARLIEDVREDLELIRRATREQHEGGKIVLANAGSSKEASHSVSRAIHEQLQTASHISKGSDSVRQAVAQIDNALQQQSAACQQVSAFLEEMRKDMETNDEAAHTMETATEQLQAQADELREKIQRFRI